ncbi:MAG TPA: GNAT family N-acetyltransferase [Candidatus Bathyarchaeia archaeon]|nr:GNAT family N-acetyltransferase [Candidatus Bathyarchaeia archaeon]
MDLLIRRARRSDKRDVLAAVRTIWGGEDRIPDVFDTWVTHRTGPFFVAESGGRVIGMGKLTVVSPTEAWLEGGRVAPRWRRKGIATALIAHRIAYARDRGFRVLRFSTASDNTPIHRAAKHFGFRRVVALSRREAPAMAAGAPPTRATRTQERAVLGRVGALVQLGHGWEWREITARDVRSAVARSRVFVSGKDVGAVAVLGQRYDASLMIAAIGGHARPLTDLLRGLRAEARRRGLDDVSFYVSNPSEGRAARSAGYTRPWSGEVYLFEKRL